MFIRSSYVYDLVSGAENAEEAADQFLSIRNCLREGGFNLWKFRTSSTELMKCIENENVKDDADRNPTKVTEDDAIFSGFGLKEVVEPADEECLKVLGIRWAPSNDELLMDLNLGDEAGVKLTKIQILRIVSGIYDPLGLLSPLVLPLRVFLQELHISGLEWDENLSPEQQRKWETLKRLTVHSGADDQFRANLFVALIIFLNMFSKWFKWIYLGILGHP